ncbi:hydrophobic surface binding protein A domain-containing protein [Trichoderma breve]|uniref:Hydrophobic surface binding protein A domain-containing protein n=1 Tax=Trichoderma breve TaxID=2034170 RepID=A0A9W9E452_9HYPO|nr:hydrophobic surface binding protein A domain-containing protein [Trichoderma breve]KAJ4855907.1 hydrophobic surface binding protein A domain-containing protein [Trichoderma breve]
MVVIAKVLWLALTATVTTATPILRRDVITVQNDITQKMGPGWFTLNQDLNNFPSSGFAGAITIRDDIADLVTILEDTLSDIKTTGSFGTVAGTTILADIQEQVPTMLASLVTIGAQESDWQAMQGASWILTQLESMNIATSNFMDAVIAAEPLFLKPGALALKAQMSGAFTTAINYYGASQ